MKFKVKSIMKKSIRSLSRNKGSYLACIVVLSLGMGVFIAMLSILDQIGHGIERFYEENRFGDVFATVRAMPANNLSRLETLEGIAAADGVLSQTVRINMNSDDIVTIKLVGVDPDAQRSVNQHSYTGEPLQYNTDIWLGKSFYNVHGFQQGDSIRLRINGKEIDFTVRGTVESPEYITIISEEAMIPDEKTYTIGYIPAAGLEGFLAMEGVVTDIGLLLEDGYLFEDVEYALEDALSKYGLTSLVKREDQTSHYYIDQEIGEVTVLGTVLPAVFLFITFIMIFIMLKRLIEQERGEIGTFKAFGFTSVEIISGYLLHGFLVGVAGFLLGLAVGYPFGNMMYVSYSAMYSLPDPHFIISREVALQGVAVSLAVSLLSVLAGALSVIKIHPAEAMRPEAPKAGHSRIDFKGKAVNFIFNKTGILALRSIMRSKVRSALVVLSITFAFAAINVVYAMGQASDDIVMKHPLLVELFDIKISLSQPQPPSSVINTLSGLEGVAGSEGLLTAGAQLLHANKKEDIVIYGIHEASSYYLIRDTDNRYHTAPRNGIILSSNLAEKLDLTVGDELELKSPYLRENAKIIVTDVIQEARGPGCYMEIETLSALFFDRLMINNVVMRTDPDKTTEVQSKLLEYPNVVDLVSQERQAEVNVQMMESFNIMIYCFIVMSFLMGFGAVYNVSRITLEEKKRELATMRILGYRIDETAAMNSFEQWIMLAAGIIVGIIPSMLLKEYLSSLFSGDLYTMHTKLTVESTLLGIAGCTLALYLSNLSARRKISRFELVEVLRERE